nr:DUF3048 C-terminal domain-containing protein [uncultured Gemmiger sp.]
MRKSIRLAAAALSVMMLAACSVPGSSESSQTTAEPTTEPTATPAPVNNTNPLTGQTTETDYNNQRPVAVTLRTGDGSTPQWGIGKADLLVEGVSEGYDTSLTAVFATRTDISKAGPVGKATDLGLQFVLPLNAVPVHIGKTIYASNLLNVLTYQDMDGLNVGTSGFTFDMDRYTSGYREENCWYTTADQITAGLANYSMDTTGANMPLFHFEERTAPETQNGTNLYITFSDTAGAELKYDAANGVYLRHNMDGTPTMDADTGAQASFKNVLVLYASSGIKDDGYTRQYDLSGGTGLYLTDGAWEQINWTKGDAAAPLSLTDASGATLSVNPGKTYLAIWGGYYGQKLQLFASDGTEQTLPEKPALLESGVSDEAAEAAKQNQDIQNNLLAAQSELAAAQQAVTDAAATEDPADDEAAAQRLTAANDALATAQAAYDAVFGTPTPAPETDAAPEGDAASSEPAAE